MSNRGGDEGEGDTPPPPNDFQVEDYDPAADIGDYPPPGSPAVPEQDLDGGGTQDAVAIEQPRQGGDQGAAPVPQATDSPPGTQSQDSSSGQASSTSGTEPVKRSGSWVLNMFGGNRSRSSTGTAGSTGNRAQRSNTSIASGSQPVSLAQQPETPDPIALGREPEPPGPGAPSPEIIGPSRSKSNSQGSTSQGRAESAQGGDNARPRATRADTGLSINTDPSFLQALGGNEGPTPLGGPRSRPSPFGPRSAGGNLGSLPTTAVDPQLVLTRRNRAFLGLYDQLRDRDIVVNNQEFQTGYERVRDWQFQLDADALEQLANRGVAAVRDVVGAPEANIPVALQNRIIGEAQRGTNNIRNLVTTALADESNFVWNTAHDIITLIDDAPAPQDRRRGSSRSSRALSFTSNASGPELHAMDPEALARRSRNELVDMVLAIEQRRQESDQEVTRLEEETRRANDAHQAEITRLRGANNTTERDLRTQLQVLQNERNYYFQQAMERPEDQPRPGPVDQQPSRDNSEEPPEENGFRPRANSAPRSPRRQRALQGVMEFTRRLAQHEDLVRQLQTLARIDTTTFNDTAEPFSANAELSRAGLGIRLRDLTENINQVTQERDETRRSETRLMNQVDALRRARTSPPSGVGSWLGSLFGGSSGREDSPPVNERSRSGSRAGPGTPIQTLADELAGGSSGGSSGSSGPAVRQSPGSGRQSGASSRRSEGGDRQSVAGSRQSDASSNNSSAYRTPPEGVPAVVHPAPLLAIPEWLAAHPNGPCGDCAPVFRFPPELGELPTCGCTCDLALRNPPPPAGRSPRAASSRSRGSTGGARSVRFEDDEQAAEGSAGRRSAPLDLSAVGNVEDDNADRPNTPYPADADGGQAGASASGEQAEAGQAQGSGGEGSGGAAPAPGEQGGTVPIQPPVEQATGEGELLVEAPPVVAAPVVVPAGRGGGRCPCCGRGVYGERPADGVPQVAFYNCRNMAGQPIPRAGEAPPAILQGVMNALGLVPAGSRPAAPGGADRGDGNPPVAPEPPAPRPRDRVMWYLTAVWNSTAGLCVLVVGYFLMICLWMVAALLSSVAYGWYLNQTHIAGRNVVRPILGRFPMWEILCVVLACLLMWFITIIIAIVEEVRIWKAANAQLTTAYFRGVVFRRPYPWHQVFEADPRLIWRWGTTP